jgi:ABC-2 type transport system ATP-binding protein
MGFFVLFSSLLLRFNYFYNPRSKGLTAEINQKISMSNILEVKNVVKKYGDYVALNEVSLSIPKGSIYGLLGPNGAGKTSLIRIINQITMPDSGEIIFDGEKLSPNHVQYIGYLPEERGLYKTMKVGEQCLYLAQMKGLSKAEAKVQLEYWFERLGIQGWWNRKIQELSKGMAQKVQFVVCVLHKPKLLIFDEPFSGFDPVNANVIKDEILELRKQGSTIIFSTHRMESVEELCDHIALIHKSNKLIEGRLDDVKRQFRTNSFEVGIISDNVEGLMYDITQKFKVGQTNFKSLNDELKLEIQLGNATPNELLSLLTQRGQVTHFVEKIPSVNDIFIQTVSEK